MAKEKQLVQPTEADRAAPLAPGGCRGAAFTAPVASEDHMTLQRTGRALREQWPVGDAAKKQVLRVLATMVADGAPAGLQVQACKLDLQMSELNRDALRVELQARGVEGLEDRLDRLEQARGQGQEGPGTTESPSGAHP
jgi:hypothetical protein